MSNQIGDEILWGCNLLSLCKQECCCFVCLFSVLGEGEDKVTSVLNPWLFREVKTPAEHLPLLCRENPLIIQADSLYQHMSAISAAAASGVWGKQGAGSGAVYRGIKNNKRRKKGIFSMQVLFSLFFFNVSCLGKRCQAESHRQRISFFSKQIYIQVVSVKFSVSSLNCPFLFLSAGVVTAISELRVTLWLCSLEAADDRWGVCGSGGGSAERRRRRKRRVGNGMMCFEMTEGAA